LSPPFQRLDDLIAGHNRIGNQISNIINGGQRSSNDSIAEFRKIAASSRNAGEVRGVGFMIGNEIVESMETKSPFKQAAVRMRKNIFENGLPMHTCGHNGNVLRFMTPLVISEALLHKGHGTYGRALKASA
jgi:4-aminobutyrate aminotransferase-like enzyme